MFIFKIKNKKLLFIYSREIWGGGVLQIIKHEQTTLAFQDLHQTNWSWSLLKSLGRSVNNCQNSWKLILFWWNEWWGGFRSSFCIVSTARGLVVKVHYVAVHIVMLALFDVLHVLHATPYYYQDMFFFFFFVP